MFGNLFSQLGQFGQPRSRAQVIQRHNESLKYLTVTLKTMKHQYHVSKNRLVKPAERLGTPPAFSSCSPILCSELQLDVVHKGCVLSGTLIVDALMMTSVQTVLEDGAEDVVQVFLYNTPQLRRCTPASSPADISAVQRVFPKGQRIAIIEPYYKVMADGTLGVRVDNPAEVVLLDEPGCPMEPTSAPHTAAGSSSSSSSFSGSGSGAAGVPGSSGAAANNKPYKPTQPNKKKGKGRKK